MSPVAHSIPLVVTREDDPAPETVRAIRAGLSAYNAIQSAVDRSTPLAVVARDSERQIKAGLYGQSYWGWLFIDHLWVDAPYRGSGLASELLRCAEAAGRERGCVGVCLNTVTFQAPAFYERRGYREFGRLEGMPAGHTRIWFAKALEPGRT